MWGNGMRYTVEVDSKDDVATLSDSEDELKSDFDSDLILAPADDAVIVCSKLNWYESVIKEMKMHLEYHGWTDDDFKNLIEEVEYNLDD